MMFHSSAQSAFAIAFCVIAPGSRWASADDELATTTPEPRIGAGWLERQERINERAKQKKITPVSADQFLVTLVGSCLYPFVAQPMIAEALGLTPKGLRDFMKRRRTELPALLKRTL